MILSPDYIISELVNAIKEQALLTAFYNGKGKLITQETKGINEQYLYQEYLCLEARVWIEASEEYLKNKDIDKWVNE